MNRAVRRTLWCFLVLIGASDLLSGQPLSENRLQQEQWKQCKSDDLAQAIVACSALIGSGKMADTALAEAFKDRGRAYFRKAAYDPAIEDFDHALQIKPHYEDTFIARA